MNSTEGTTAHQTGRVAVRLLLLLGLLAVLVLAEAPERTRFWDAFLDAGHAPLFGLVALLARGLLAAQFSAWTERRLSVVALGVTSVIGALTELLQVTLPTRAASIGDLLRDAAGAGAFLLLLAARTERAAVRGPRGAARSRVARTALGVALLAAVAAPLGVVMAQYGARNRTFPTLYRLDGSWWERPLVSTGNAELIPAHGPAGRAGARPAQLARLLLRPGSYSGVVLEEPYPDWRGFKRLAFTVVSDLDRPMTLTVRINDAAHDQRYDDRFNERIVIVPGENPIQIPLDEVRRAPRDRQMDMRRIRLLLLYAHRLERPATLRLGPLRLE